MIREQDKRIDITIYSPNSSFRNETNRHVVASLGVHTIGIGMTYNLITCIFQTVHLTYLHKMHLYIKWFKSKVHQAFKIYFSDFIITNICISGDSEMYVDFFLFFFLTQNWFVNLLPLSVLSQSENLEINQGKHNKQ